MLVCQEVAITVCAAKMLNCFVEFQISTMTVDGKIPANQLIW